MKKKALFTVLTASLMCAAAAITLAACGDDEPAAVTKYKVIYAGGGETVTGTAPTEVDRAAGEKFSLKANTFTNEGKDFQGWKYGETTYNAGVEFTMPASDVTFTAQWAPAVVRYTVTYALEGGEWSYPDEAPATTVDADEEITLPNLYAVSKTGRELYGWTIDEENYEPGDSYTVSGNVTITAVWGAERVGVSYSGGNRISKNVGRFVPGETIELEALPTEWESETKEFTGKWLYSYYDAEDEDADDDGLVTKKYEVGDEFTVPAAELGYVNLRAEWNPVGIYLNFYEIDSWDAVRVLYKPDDLDNPGSDYLNTFMEQIPELTADAPEGTEVHWVYVNSYEDEDEITHIEYIVCYMGADAERTAQTLALLKGAIEEGTEEVDVIAEVSKIVGSKTLNSWNTVAESLPIQYGQTVTVTADVKVTGTEKHEWFGVFGYLAKANDATVNTKLRWDGVFSDNPGNGADQSKYEALGVAQAKEVVITKNGTKVDNTVELLISLFPYVSNFQIVADYTTEGTIVITVAFDAWDDNFDSYSYTGTATYTALDPHAGLAQKYLFGIGGESATVKNVKFIVEGDVETVTPPEYPDHDWTQENNWVCTVCGKINPDHSHSYNADDICTICGEPNPEHTHRYTNGICTVCGGVEAYAADNGYIAVGTSFTNVGADGVATTDMAAGVTLAKGSTMVVLGTQTQNFANHENKNWFSLIIEFVEGYTLRSDNFGWKFGDTDKITGHEGEYDVTYVDGKTGNADKWVDFKTIAADCNWCVVYDWTGDNLVVTLYMTAKGGSLEGCTYRCAYTLTTDATLETVTPKFGGEHLDAYAVDGYKVVAPSED